MINKLKQVIEQHYEQSDYPTLGYQCEKWGATRPLAGIRLLDATPLFRNTLSKYIPLIAAGAELVVGLSPVMPCDPQIVRLLGEIGLKTVTPNDTDEEFDIILDCAAAFAGFTARIGYVELTRSGVGAYADCTKPVYVADSSHIKRIETSLGTGEAYFRAMAQLGYTEWAGRRLVIFGNGKVGKGLSIYGRQSGAVVAVFDENSSRGEVEQAIAEAYAVVTATGVKDALASYAEQLNNSSALIANMGVEDEFSEQLATERVLAAKRPLNFILDEPTHLRYIETTMALHNHGAVELLSLRHQKGLIQPTDEVENELLDVVRNCGKINLNLL